MRRNARTWFGRAEHDNNSSVSSDEYALEDFSEIRDDDEPPGVRLAIGNDIQIAIVRPRNFRDAATIGEYYRREIPVVISLEDMTNEEAGRIIDFVSGLILGLCGGIERVSRRIFVIVPVGATILTKHNSLTDESFFNQALQSANGAVSPGQAGPAGPWSRPAG